MIMELVAIKTRNQFLKLINVQTCNIALYAIPVAS